MENRNYSNSAHANDKACAKCVKDDNHREMNTREEIDF